MLLPIVNDETYSYSGVVEFKGYVHKPMIEEGEFFDTKNMSTRGYPQLMPRQKRMKIADIGTVLGFTAHEHLAWLTTEGFFYDGVKIPGITVQGEYERKLVCIGAYVCIFPDGIMYNTSNGEITYADNKTVTSTSVTISLCMDELGNDFDRTPVISDVAPEDPENGDLWIDTSDQKHWLKKWYEAQGMWSTIATTYVKIAADNIGVGFKDLDGIEISGLSNDELNGKYYIEGCSNNYIVITALIDQTETQSAPVTVERKMPENMEYFCVQDNRVWSCSSLNHEIYASALGDPTNWNRFYGISSDSYAMTVGSPGDFTGCTSFGGYLYFFKEDRILKIYGTKPANYQLSEIIARGVQKGSEKSICIANEQMYYKTTHGFVYCDGGMPYEISDALGDTQYDSVVSGVRGDRYYASARNVETGKHELLVLDVNRGLWIKEDDAEIDFFAVVGTELYFVKGTELWSVGGTSEITVITDKTVVNHLEDAIEWEVITGDLDLQLPFNKWVKRLIIRAEIPSDADFSVDVMYDSEDEELEEWMTAGQFASKAYKLFRIPIIPRRADRLKLRIRGTGDVRIFAITRIIESGGEGGKY